MRWFSQGHEDIKKRRRACKIPKRKNCSKKEVTGDFLLSTAAYKMNTLQRVLHVQWRLQKLQKKMRRAG
jgi:hypothetical protein